MATTSAYQQAVEYVNQQAMETYKLSLERYIKELEWNAQLKEIINENK